MNPIAKEEPTTLTPADCRQASEVWDQICQVLSVTGHLFLFSDFDGTLARITPVPADAAIEPLALAALKKLTDEKHVTIAILSGRSVPDVANRVGLPVIYGGDHGLEIHGPDFNFVTPGAEAARRTLLAFCNDIRKKTAEIPGTLVEVKSYTASVHYRQVPPDLVPELSLIVRSSVDPARFEVRDGHSVFEIRPRVNWGKGEAVRWILDRYHAADDQAICLGDDETDEDMFQSVRTGVNIRVNRPPETKTSAQYCMNQEHVYAFLEGLRDLVQGVSCASAVNTHLQRHSIHGFAAN